MNDVNEEMIDVKPICWQFKKYLEIDNRCILSAKFGDGKSYFLSQFTQMYNDEFLFITIYPVNYQVMDNSEIFELIKRDILLRLLSENVIDSNNIEFTESFKAAYYLSQNYEEIFENLIQIIPQINFSGLNIDIGNIFKGIKSIRHGYKEWEKEIDETKEEKADNFIKGFDNSKGSIYEFDAISQLIYNIISDYKKSSGKKIVLIIEDLDRIDPAHIFRILNVFSAHFDNQAYGENNKYNFDKIITVCDYNNIKNIYHHVYGAKTDFIGYIAKFSNKEPFNYSLKNLLKDYIIKCLLDKSILDYTSICNKLCDCIIHSFDSAFNLRILKEGLLNAEKMILDVNIELEKDLKGNFIKASNALSYILSLTKSFKIDIFDIIDRENLEETIQLIGINWLLLSIIVNKNILLVNILQNEIKIMYDKELMHGRYTDYTNLPIGTIKVMNCNDKEIMKVQIYPYKGSNVVLEELLYNQMDKIFKYYKEKSILLPF